MAAMRASQALGSSMATVENPPPGMVCNLLREASPVMRKAVVPFCIVGTVVMVLASVVIPDGGGSLGTSFGADDVTHILAEGVLATVFTSTGIGKVVGKGPLVGWAA